MNREEVLTIKEVSRVMQVGRRTVYNWIERQQVTVVRAPSGKPYILKSSLWQDGHRHRVVMDHR